MKDKSLVILAAGMGSRFGGPKQLYPVGPNGEFIMDYSIYSAVKYGFNKIVFITRDELVEEFKNTIGKRLEGKVEVEYVIQRLDEIPEGYTVPEGRVKPWGTAHALYCAKNYVADRFAVISADDFYGDECFKQLSDALDGDAYSIIGYRIGDTLSKNGTVNRGVIISHDGIVDEIIESCCELENDKVKCTPLNKEKPVMYVEKDNSVSMLMNGFNKELFITIDKEFKKAFEENKDNLSTYEFLLPDIITKEIINGKTVLDIPTSSKWVGLTYKEDAEKLREYILGLIEKNVYPSNLWN